LLKPRGYFFGVIVELPVPTGVGVLPGIGVELFVGNGSGFVGTRLVPGAVIVPTVGSGIRLGSGTGVGAATGVGDEPPMDVKAGGAGEAGAG
jgi:hypothetical protein